MILQRLRQVSRLERTLEILACLILIVASDYGYVNNANAQNQTDVALSRQVDCAAFAGVLEGFYTQYRKATGDGQYIEAEKQANSLQLAWAQILYDRMEREIDRKRDADSIRAQMDWIYQSGKALPDHTGLGNAVVIFENRIASCNRDLVR